MDELVRFVADRLAKEVAEAHWRGTALVTHMGSTLEIPIAAAERQARLIVQAANAQQALFEQTVRPFLGTAGTTGRVAEEQLRLLALMHAGHEDYRPEWSP